MAHRQNIEHVEGVHGSYHGQAIQAHRCSRSIRSNQHITKAGITGKLQGEKVGGLVERLTIGLVGVIARKEEVVAVVTWCRAGALSWYSPQSSSSASIRGVVVLPAVRFDGTPEFHGLRVGDGVHGVVSSYSAPSRAARRSWAAAPSAPRGSAVVHDHSSLGVDMVAPRCPFPFPFFSSSSTFPLFASPI
jgi:hypothetical protein